MHSMQDQPTPSAERTALYRLYDADGALLYVGISTNLDERWKCHAMTRPWWPRVASKAVEWINTWSEAASVEEVVIRREKPLFNGTHNYPVATFSPDRWPRITGRDKVQKLAELIRLEIKNGRWRHGQKVPTCTELGAATGLSKSSATLAIRALQDEELLTYLHGFGMFVDDGSGVPRRNRVRE